MDKISLTASMRSNLLSLQTISGQVSSTQNKLSTGNKVNSAIDNPGSYYTALSLNNRADDLNALLDSMGQAVSTIKAATTALESAADFLEQASAVATQALETAKMLDKSFFEEKADVAAVVSSWDELKAVLDSGKQGNIVIYGHIEAKDTITLKAGQNLVGVGYYGVDEPDTDKFSELSFDLEALGKTDAIKTEADNIIIADITIKSNMRKNTISNIINFDQTQNHQLSNIDLLMNTENQVSYNEDQSVVSTAINNGKNITIKGYSSIYENISSKESMILSVGIRNAEVSVYGTLNIQMKQEASRGISSCTINTFDNAVVNIISPYRGTNQSTLNINDKSILNISAGSCGISFGEVSFNDNSTVNIFAPNGFSGTVNYPLKINQGSSAKVNFKGTNLFDRIDLTYNAVVGSEIGLNGKVYKAETMVNDNTMNGNSVPQGFIEIAGAVASPVSSLEWLTKQNANRYLADYYKNKTEEKNKQYQEIIGQYDTLIKDASYKGINLLQSDKLSVKFNEDNTANLSFQGKDMSSQALGFTVFDWQTQGDIADSLAEIASALKSIRNYSSELGNNYSIITTRQDFTNSLINVLTEGADKLTLADMNEESANMLALQTRQQLAINSLSLASQASQSILKLF